MDVDCTLQVECGKAGMRLEAVTEATTLVHANARLETNALCLNATRDPMEKRKRMFTGNRFQDATPRGTKRVEVGLSYPVTASKLRFLASGQTHLLVLDLSISHDALNPPLLGAGGLSLTKLLTIV